MHLFNRLDINMHIGMTNGEAEDKIRLYYYIITQQAHPHKYRTDCYVAFFEEQRKTVTKGFSDAP